ncbi:Hypothetical protein PHPALM_3692 [Phytophthora palmivora]|uniref:Reverse transcriptase RNase H-like domain-containing protein n=1 Tax=Phytophthora palmivora TaxID=4796 RepID=A0A2P4YLS4_9STRA|nr:Hypothetical protein PHPALM_3692 [Phytophthora palmivora]
MEERLVFGNIQEKFATATTLDFSDDAATTYLLTDASDIGCSLTVTQVNVDPKCLLQTSDIDLCILNRTVIEKEAFLIVMACGQLDCLLLKHKSFRIYYDHRNLIHVFAPHQNDKRHIKGRTAHVWESNLNKHLAALDHVLTRLEDNELFYVKLSNSFVKLETTATLKKAKQSGQLSEITLSEKKNY